MNDFNTRVITQFRTGGGRVGGWGDRLVLIHSTGARTGLERVNPALSLRDGDDRLVVASAAGARARPAWYHNLRAHPDIMIETPAGPAAVTARELEGAEYDRAWHRFQAVSDSFARYRDSAGRPVPIFRLSPRPVAV
ncbi:nitroreductase family deazaflavin-dependent oxidoreductase [Streptomyces gardneri]|uniref:nitroreductase/quinone reductase family protein n=1 Tax=Nocardia sputi TaxID=2943705 RepID=UPI0018955A0A|nr:nitroreductase/quinone reductase family protein [Nocardia sputi]MBF6168721.1 nitroreductase family deazaflavin-dependent oxidoreductase [Streptomyces gardneri]